MITAMEIDDEFLETNNSLLENNHLFDYSKFNPMQIEYHATNKELDACKKRIEQTVFPRKYFKSDDEREQYVLEWHKELNCKTYKELVERIAYIHITNQYCHWCRDYNIDNTIVEHEHIKGNAGRYRGVLCKRCNRLEAVIKNKLYQEKIDYLYQKIGTIVNNDYHWVTQCINQWYSKSV